MRFGPHTEAVQEVVEFVTSGGVLANPHPIINENWKIIRSFDEVGDYIHPSPDVTDGEGYDWPELLELGGEPTSGLADERFRQRKANPGLIEALSGLIDGPIYKSLCEHLRGRYSNRDIQYIVANLDAIVRYRATFGRSVPFIERLIEVYKLGGHPCGWVGSYPEGQLVTYFPTDFQIGPPGNG